MATYNKFQDFAERVGLKVHDFNADTFKAYLSNEQPLAADTIKTDIAEISAGNGYTAGGFDLVNTYSEASGTGSVATTDPTWTASGGSIGPFQFVVVYNDTDASDRLIAWWDVGSATTITNGNTFTVNIAGDVLFTLA
jgi:hypothetical protein